jgi:hypothetical protein
MDAGAGLPAGRNGGAQIIPRDRFRLLEERRHIGKARPHPFTDKSRTMQILNAGHRLARPAVGDDAGEPLGARMKRKKLTARPVRDGDLGALRFQIFHGQSPGSSIRREMCTLRDANRIHAAPKHWQAREHVLALVSS